jgi:hypothetical protein
MLTESYASPVNFKNQSGQWRPIERRLVPSGSGWRNVADSFALSFPRSAAAPVSLRVGAASVSLSLLGGRGGGSASGTLARYPDVLPATDAAYESTAGGLDETLTLKGVAAPRMLHFDISSTGGLRARQMTGGAVGLFDRQGRLWFYVAPSLAYPAHAGRATARPLHSALRSSGKGWVLSLDLDEPWLRSDLSAGPVIVDPSITYGHEGNAAGNFGPSRICTLKAESPTTSFCKAEANFTVGGEGSKEKRALLAAPTLPRNGVLLEGFLNLTLVHQSNPKNKVNLGFYRGTREWTSSATWDTYDGTHSWTTAGGDYSEGGDSAVLDGIGGGEENGHYEQLVNITQVMQEWANGPESKVGQGYADDGLMLKLATGSGSNTLEFIGNVTGGHENAIYATEWEEGGQGDSPEYTMLPFPLTDRMSISVNAASGNLLVDSNDLHVTGRGLDFNASRVYNSLNDFENEFGNWQDSNQSGLRKESSQSEGSPNLIWLRDGSGAWFQFYWNASTSEYITPPGIKATLCASYSAPPCPVSSTYRLTFNESQTRIDFNLFGAPVDVEDRYGNKLTSNGGNYPPTQWTDTEERHFTYTKEKTAKEKKSLKARTHR